MGILKKPRTAWNKGRKMSEETKRKISEAKKGTQSWNKGVPMSEETRIKMSKAATVKKKSKEFCENRSRYMKTNNHFKGKTHTEESLQKMREAKKDSIPWNKGKTGIYSEETLKKMRAWNPSEETRKKMSLAKGDDFVPWNKGRTGVYSEETLKRMGDANKGNSYRKGAHHTEETLKKMMGKKFSAATRKKMSIAQRKRVVPFKDSTIEIKVQKFLNNLGIKFKPHKYMGEIKYAYQCDMFVPAQEVISNKTVIECDGDYWHGNIDIIPAHKLPQHRKAQRCLDYERTAQLEDAGFTVIRLPEYEIREMDEDKFKERMLVTC